MPSEPCVYIVDDDPTIRSSLELLLSTADISTEGFADAEAFLDGADLGRPTCILLDVRLPGMSGLELLGRLMSMNANAAVIMITGHGDVPMAVTAMRAGALHFVEKPVDPEALLATVQEALSHAEELTSEQARADDIQERFAALTPREREVLDLVVEGDPSKVIAYKLGISARTVEHHRTSVMKKTKARTLSHLVRMALDLSRASSTSQ